MSFNIRNITKSSDTQLHADFSSQYHASLIFARYELQYAFQDTDLPLDERREGAKQSKNKELSRFLYSTRGYSVDLTFDRWGLPPI